MQLGVNLCSDYRIVFIARLVGTLCFECFKTCVAQVLVASADIALNSSFNELLNNAFLARPAGRPTLAALLLCLTGLSSSDSYSELSSITVSVSPVAGVSSGFSRAAFP